MSSTAPTNVSFTQSQDLQRQIESVVLKMETAGLLQENAGDHIRVIVAEGIAEYFGDRYRVYPSVPRPESVAIRRDLVPMPCVLTTKAKKKNNTMKAAEPIAVGTSGPPSSKTDTTTSRGATRRVSAWAVGVANASSVSTSPEKSIIYKNYLAANPSRWDAALDDPIKISTPGSRGSYALSGRKTEKRHVSPTLTKDDARSTKFPIAVKADDVTEASTAPAGQPVIKNTVDTSQMDGSDLDAFFGIPPRTSPPKATITLPVPKATMAIEATNTDDWLIDLSS